MRVSSEGGFYSYGGGSGHIHPHATTAQAIVQYLPGDEFVGGARVRNPRLNKQPKRPDLSRAHDTQFGLCVMGRIP